jgi:tellurite resistance protein
VAHYPGKEPGATGVSFTLGSGVPFAAMADNNENKLRPQEIEVFARGLWYLATIDGASDPREEALIREFLEETKSTLTWAEVTRGDFAPLEAANLLESSFLRRIFMKLAVALVHADGVYTDNERKAIGEFADVFGMSNAAFGEIEQAGKRTELPG